MKKNLLFLAGFLAISGSAWAQQNQWTKVSEKNVRDFREGNITVSEYKLLSLNKDELSDQLSAAPDRSRMSRAKGVLIKFPNDQGAFDTYEVYEASTMNAGLQSRYSDIRSYIGTKAGEPSSTIRFTLDPYFGLNAVVKNTKGMYYMHLLKAGLPVC